jgi:hypothetical protein
MLEVIVESNRIIFGDGLALSFQRTLRIPDDNQTYPLPPGLDQFPILRIEDYADSIPPTWLEQGGVFIPMYQQEALWISFDSREWKPNAVKIGVGMVNAVSGKPWQEELSPDEADYLVCPPQLWLDGINAGEGFIRQFVAMPLGQGYTVEAQVRSEETFGGIQIVVYEPKPGVFPDQPPPKAFGMRSKLYTQAPAASEESFSLEMGMGAGGKMKQSIYPDPHGIEVWDPDTYGRIFVHIVNSQAYKKITGNDPPASPVDAKTYTQYGLPWFDLYDDHLGDVAAPETLQNVHSIAQIAAEADSPAMLDDSGVEISPDQVIHYQFGDEND